MQSVNGYSSSGTYTTNITALSGNVRFHYEVNNPIGTSISIEYSCEDTPETWTLINDGDSVIVSGNLWLRYTLETTDPNNTPTLLAIWLEEGDIPPDTILLTMTEDGRFNNAEGLLTIKYDAALGNLKGTRPVENFEVSFLPTDLLPSILHEHTITARGKPIINFIKVSYVDGYTQHTITATAGDIKIDFIHVDDIIT